MIPKIVHYVWMGGQKPDSVKQNIDNWKKILPDYEFMEWNDQNWNVEHNTFSKYFYSLGRKGYAFVSDDIRLHALYDFGGIYMDTDVHLYKKFDSLLNESLVLGKIYDNAIGTATILSEKKNPMILDLINYYDSLDKKMLTDPTFDKINNGIFTRYLIKKHSDINFHNKITRLNNDVLVLPKQYFELPNFWYENGGFAVHEQLGSWGKKNSNNVPTVGFKNNLKKIIKYNFPRLLIRYQNMKAGKKNSIAREFGSRAPK